MSDAPRFDDFQFQGRRARAVSAETKISFQDYDKMHLHKREGHVRNPRRVPPWALDNKKIARVIRVRLWTYAHNVGEPPPAMSLEELEAEVAVRRSKYSESHRNQKAHLRSTARHSYGGYIARLIWLAFRLNYTSSQIAAEMNLTSVQTRQQLHRICDVARKLFPDDSFAPFARLRTRLGTVKNPEFTATVRKMRQAGKTFVEIGAKLGCTAQRASRVVRRDAKPRPRPNPFARAALRVRIIERRNAGVTWKKIGKELGYDAGTVRSWVQKDGQHG